MCELCEPYGIYYNTKVIFCRYCPKLTSIPDLSKFEELISIDIVGCANLTTFSDLSQNKKLIGISCFDCPKLTNVPNLPNCTVLEEIIFFNCPEITYIPDLSKFETLKKIVIYNCPKLILKGLPDISKLTDFMIYGPKVIDIPRDLPNIKYYNF
jgi:hypothetical protein